MNNLQFYKANIVDLERIMYLSQQTFIDAYGGTSNDANTHKYIATSLNEEVLTKELLDNGHIFFIVKKGKVDVGYLKLRWKNTLELWTNQKAIELQRFYLLAAYYNQGIGKEMLAFSLNYAQKRHFLIIWLLVWNENIGAIRFYCRGGFSIFELKEFIYGDDIEIDYLMKLTLNNQAASKVNLL